MIKMLLGGAAVATALIAAPASAATFTFTNIGSTNTYGAMGNSYGPMTNGGVTLNSITAWSTPNNDTKLALSAADLPDAAFLGRYANSNGGLGVTNNNEGTGGNLTHVVDNLVSYDFIRFEFDKAVNLTGMSLNGYTGSGLSEKDAWVSFGSGDFSTVANWQSYLDNGVGVSGGTTYISSNYAKVWLIGASRLSDDRNDGFKLGSIGVTAAPAVPEPATWGMMILGFGVIGSAMRRRSTRVTFA